ncbi:hypothetical protein PanWU01x14_271040, partial [Parasponia andersonii]
IKITEKVLKTGGHHTQRRISEESHPKSDAKSIRELHQFVGVSNSLPQPKSSRLFTLMISTLSSGKTKASGLPTKDSDLLVADD